MIYLPRYVETIVWIGLYAASVVFAVNADGSSPTYRAVFIAGTSADWLPDANRDYVLGHPIPVSEPSPFFAKGWWRPERDGRWGKGKLSTIILRPTSALPAGSRIIGQVDALVGGHQLNQVISIGVNGTEVDRLIVSADKRTQNFESLLPTPIAAGSQVEVAFEVPNAQSPLILGAGEDARELGVRLNALALFPPAQPGH